MGWLGHLISDISHWMRPYLFEISIALMARVVMTFSGSAGLALAGGLFPLALGEALMGPVMVAAIKRCATTAQRSISFS